MAKAFNGEMFQRVPINPPGRNVFDLSHENKFTTEFGRLTPVMCEEVIPGDKWKVSTSTFIRMMPLVAPIMHEVNAYLHFFFVPRRLLWTNWQDFITGVDNAGGIDGSTGGSEHLPHCIDGALLNNAAYLTTDHVSYKRLFSPKSLWDYLGYPTLDQDGNCKLWEHVGANEGDSSRIEVDPLLAYQLIWNEYYRDQNIDYAEFDLKFFKDKDGVTAFQELFDNWHPAYWGNGRNVFMLKYRAWEKDYFTSALPEPQRGPDVSIPLDIDAEIGYNHAGGASRAWLESSKTKGSYNITFDNTLISNGKEGFLGIEGDDILYQNLAIDNSDQLTIEVARINSTINDLRMAMRLQEFYELSARVGNRYKEMIVGHFGVFTPDYRLDRPQYLGGSKFPLQISQVLQTSQTNNPNQPLGDMAGHGIGGSSNFQFTEEFYEHGYIICIMSIIPRSSYQQGLHRKFTRFDRLDHYWEKFAHLGEQEVKVKELYYDWLPDHENVPNVDNQNDETFGYQSRYSEYKYIANHVHGDFKDSLNYWHLGRRFSRAPSLGNEFIIVKSDSNLYGADVDNNKQHNLNRIFAYQGTDFDHFLCQVYFDIKAVRPMPIYGVPKL